MVNIIQNSAQHKTDFHLEGSSQPRSEFSDLRPLSESLPIFRPGAPAARKPGRRLDSLALELRDKIRSHLSFADQSRLLRTSKTMYFGGCKPMKAAKEKLALISNKIKNQNFQTVFASQHYVAPYASGSNQVDSETHEKLFFAHEREIRSILPGSENERLRQKHINTLYSSSHATRDWLSHDQFTRKNVEERVQNVMEAKRLGASQTILRRMVGKIPSRSEQKRLRNEVFDHLYPLTAMTMIDATGPSEPPEAE